MKHLFAALVLLLAGSMALAPGQYYRNRQTHQHDNHNHRRIVNVAEVITVAQINPAYVSTFQPDGYDSALQADLVAQLRALSVRLDAHDKATLAALVAKAAGPVVVVPPPSTLPPPGAVPPVAQPAPKGVPTGQGGAFGLIVVQNQCAACHQAGKLAPDQRFTLLDAKGGLASLTDKQKLKVLQKVYMGMMPPPNNVYGIKPVTDEGYATIMDLLAGN